MSTVSQARSEHYTSRRTLYYAFVRDAITVASLGILCLSIHEFAVPFARGFNCNDETIRYPYKGSTVSSGLCYSVGSGINIALILILEYFRLTANSQITGQAQTSTQLRDLTSERFNTRVYFRNVYCRLIIWFFGAITTELLTNITKVTAGRLRPHFIDVCNPRIEGRFNVSYYCTETTKPYEYITDYVCTGEPKKQRDARLSFLSGHSSYSAFSATFAIIYIQESLDVNKFGLLKPALQVLLASMAFYTGLSRISDYKHHWQDVLAGLLLGTAIASLVPMYVWPLFYKTYARFSNKSVTAKQTDSPMRTPTTELNRLGY